MNVKLTLGILGVFALINFSCKESTAKEGEVHIVKSKIDENPVKIFSTVAPVDTVHAGHYKTGARIPSCCKGAPSRFRSHASTATANK